MGHTVYCLRQLAEGKQGIAIDQLMTATQCLKYIPEIVHTLLYGLFSMEIPVSQTRARTMTCQIVVAEHSVNRRCLQ